MDRLTILEKQMDSVIRLTVITSQLATTLAKSHADWVEAMLPESGDQTEALRSVSKLEQLQASLAELQGQLTAFEDFLRNDDSPKNPLG